MATFQQLAEMLDEYVKMVDDDYRRNAAVHTWAPPIDAMAWQISKNRQGTMAIMVDVLIGPDRMRDLAFVGSFEAVVIALEERMRQLSESILNTPVVSEEHLLAIANGQAPAIEQPKSFEDDLKASGLAVED